MSPFRGGFLVVKMTVRSLSGNSPALYVTCPFVAERYFTFAPVKPGVSRVVMSFWFVMVRCTEILFTLCAWSVFRRYSEYSYFPRIFFTACSYFRRTVMLFLGAKLREFENMFFFFV